MYSAGTRKPPEPVHVLEGLVDNRETDDGVDEKRIRADASEHAEEQCDAVADGEQADVLDDVPEPVEKEDDADEEQEMVVSRDHVLGAQIHQRADGGALQALKEDSVLARDAVRLQTGRPRGNERRRQGRVHEPRSTGADTWHGSCHTFH